MGTKMLSAFDATGAEITTDERARGRGIEPFKCTGCGIGVSYVPAHPKERDGKPYLVHAFYRLKPNTTHQETCKFAVEDKVSAIAARSDGLLESLKKGKYRFRLLTINHEPDSSLSKSSAKESKQTKSHRTTSTEFEKSDTRSSPRTSVRQNEFFNSVQLANRTQASKMLWNWCFLVNQSDGRIFTMRLNNSLPHSDGQATLPTRFPSHFKVKCEISSQERRARAYITSSISKVRRLCHWQATLKSAKHVKRQYGVERQLGSNASAKMTRY